EAVSGAEPRSEVIIMVHHSQVRRISSHARDNKSVVHEIVVREASRKLRYSWRIQLPSHAKVERELGSYNPLILDERENLPGPVGGEVSSQVTSRLARKIEQEAGEVVVVTCARTTFERRLAGVEGIDAARTECLILQQIVSNAPDVASPLNCVIAPNFVPRVGDVDIRFSAYPRQAGGVTDDVVRIECIQVDSDHPAVERPDVHAGDANRGRGVGTVVGIRRLVMVMRYADAELGDQSGCENTIIV